MSKTITKHLKFSIVLLGMLAWTFSGWPKIWRNPSFPPEIQKALAAQVTIDAAVNTTATSHLGGSPTTVFISQSTGYAFYRGSDGDCSYRKTTDGGANWGALVNVTNGVANLDNDCLQIAVWWDQWTPGDSGSLIHMAVIDGSGTAAADDDIWYATINTASSDANSGFVNITTGVSYAGSLAVGTNHVAIAKGTDGALYAAVTDASDNIMVRCTATCTTAGSWAVSEPASWAAGNDYQLLIPRLSGEMMFIWWDTSATTNELRYSRYTGSWSAFANVDSTVNDNGTYDASFGAAVNPSNGDVYLAYVQDAATLGTDDDILVSKFSGSSWSSLTDVVTNSVCAGVSNCGITGAKIARDNNTGHLYVLYSAQSTAGTASTGNVYWKYSTDDGSTWSAEFGPAYSTNDDIYGARLSLMPTSNERIYATWYAATPDDLFGRPIAPKTFEQSAYRFFANTDSTDVGSALAAQDTAATLSSAGAAFRLRMLIHVGVSDLFTNEGSFKLQFAERSGTCDTGFSGESYADVTGATAIAYNDNATPADGASLTGNANDPTHGGDSIVNQTYEEANNFTNSQGAVNVGQDGKWDFALIDNGAPANTAYCFRILRSNGSLLETYTVIPQITTAAAPTVSCDVSITSTSFGTLSTGSVTTASPNASTTMSCTHSAGCTLFVQDAGNGSNGGLATTTPAYLIPSPNAAFDPFAVLVAGTEGYGIVATTTPGGSGGTLTIYSRYDKDSGGTTVGKLQTTTFGLASSTAAVSNRQLIITHKAAISVLTNAAKYEDAITYSCAGN